MKKGYLDIQFSWIFALFVGAMILFFAIFFIVKFVKTETSSQDIQTSKEIGILLNALQISYEEGTSNMIQLPQYSKIYSQCKTFGSFGIQGILLNQKVYGKWQESKVPVEFEDKYLFIDDYAEGRSFYLFSKPFYFPFKIATLIYLTPSDQQYCFFRTPPNIEKELLNINQENLVLSESNCTTESAIRICFLGNAQNCNINVKYDEKFLTKDGKTFWFNDDATMYAAIFSDKESYECQMSRLMKRTTSLSELYMQKLFLNSYFSCKSDLLTELENFLVYLKSWKLSFDFLNSETITQSLDYQNRYCKIW